MQGLKKKAGPVPKWNARRKTDSYRGLSPTDGRIAEMKFIVQFLRDIRGSAKPSVIQTVDIESDDLYAVVSRIRIILSIRDFQPTIGAFQIVADDKQVVYHECRQEPDACRIQS
jgi:hypothetical protein